MKILMIGDVIGRPGRNTLKAYIAKKKNDYDFIIINGENSAGGFGITEKIAQEFFKMGVDVITSGNHIWDKRETIQYIQEEDRLLRPLNYPKGTPGEGYVIKTAKNGQKIGVISTQGRIFMSPCECPFLTITPAIEAIKKETNIILVDFHAEATSEKIAYGLYLDGKVSGVFGTHTHVQTADEKILPEGTAYITDLGLTGSHAGIIGMKKDDIIDKFLTGLPKRFEVESGLERLSGVEVEVSEISGKALNITRLDVSLEDLI